MKIDKAGRDFIYKEEGAVLHAYLDQVGVATIGVGFTFYPVTGKKVKMGETITQAQCDQIFDQIIKLYEEGVNGAIKVVLTQNQFNSLVSLAFNIGVAAFTKSTLVKKINVKSPIAEIEKWLLVWRNAGGQPILLPRRKREFKLFIS